MNQWSEQLNVDFPSCNMCGACCKCASPSLPEKELKKLKEQGDEYATAFLDIFEPYGSIEEARKVNPFIVEKSIESCTDPQSEVSVEDLVFYKCKHIAPDNKCSVHEDRPHICRDYPDSPFLIFDKNCAYNRWSEECKSRFASLQQELEVAKQLQDINEKIKLKNKLDDQDYDYITMLSQLCLVSPASTHIKLPR